METKQVIRVIPFILITACGLLTSCSGGGMTLGEIDKLSPSERSVIQELKITDIKGDGELNLTETLQGFRSLKKLEIAKSFTGTLMGGACDRQIPHLETLIAKGVTIIGWEMFNGSSEIKNVELPNASELMNHAFSGDPNNIESLDFPNLRVIGGYAFKGCRNLKILKLGSSESIACYAGVFGTRNEVHTEQVDLYLGKYEYTHNVEGNQWITHSKPNQNMISFDNTATTGKVDIHSSGEEGEVTGILVFKNIYPY